MLSAHLLRERDVARFIVAPDGYGKSSLAAEYAETIFSWTHTFWVNAKSPCFIRDLDAHVLASSCLTYDDEAALVVFDDLPPLESHRTRAFSEVIDALLAAHCEVIVTCVPTCDTMGGLQPDRIRLDARDLLLDDAELDDARSSEERARKPANLVGASGRIPAIAWASDEHALHVFAKSALDEEMPAELLFAVASTLVIQSGSFYDLQCIGSLDKAVFAELSHDYPHLGFDDDLDRFEAPQLGMKVIAAPVKRRLSALVGRSSFGASEQLVRAWADLLMRAGKAGRACDLVREVCPRRSRAAWLVEHAQHLASRTCFFPMFKLARDQDSCKGEARVRLGAVEGLCRMVLGDDAGAMSCAKRHAYDSTAPQEVRTCDLLMMARLEKGRSADKVDEALKDTAARYPSRRADGRFDWCMLAQAWVSGRQGPAELARFCNEALGRGAGDAELCICMSWLFSLIEEGDDSVAMSPEVRACERYVRARLRSCLEGGPDYFTASAGLSLEAARNRGVHGEAGMLDAAVLMQLRTVEMDVLAQRRQFEEDLRATAVRKNDWSSTHPASASASYDEELAARSKRSVPILEVKLFGHFEATLGGVPLDPKRFNQRNARSLFVLLAMNHGRDLSRESIERAMWPQSSEEVAHKNYYSVWSTLRKALTLPDGTCPYLIRHRYGCRLETRYAHSDVERFNEICRELLFGVPNVDKWSALFTEIDRDFSSDLMPAERKNRLIVQARNEYRSRLVDALVAATFSVIGVDSPQWGIWFARTALAHDETREDAYIALMRAQIAGNQRTAAMMTYLKCRRILSEQLGIDPSPEITMLYESLLDAE